MPYAWFFVQIGGGSTVANLSKNRSDLQWISSMAEKGRSLAQVSAGESNPVYISDLSCDHVNEEKSQQKSPV